MRRLISIILIVSLSGAVAIAQQVDAARPSASSRLILNARELDTRLEPNLLTEPARLLVSPRPVVIQLKGPISSAQRIQLNKLGVVLNEYVPDHAYIADVRRVSRQQLAAMPYIQWVGEYRKDWKCSPKIGRRRTPFKTDERVRLAGNDRVRLVVTLFANENLKHATVALENPGRPFAVVSELPKTRSSSWISIRIAFESLAEIDSIQFVEEAPELTLRNDTTRWIVQSNQSGVFPFYDNGIHGENQIIGIMDGQPDKDHCSLDGGKFLFYNTFDGNNFHGTHVSCTAAGDDTSGANRRGVAYSANMVFNSVPSFTETGITTNLDLHHSQGARIHTNSWGDDGTTAYNGLCRGFDDFLYQHEDDFVCLAVTNGSQLRNPENARTCSPSVRRRIHPISICIVEEGRVRPQTGDENRKSMRRVVEQCLPSPIHAAFSRTRGLRWHVQPSQARRLVAVRVAPMKSAGSSGIPQPVDAIIPNARGNTIPAAASRDAGPAT